ncbi:MAG: hypothetical protein ACRD5K_05440 [Candidatus Acidiferrales bacterium]
MKLQRRRVLLWVGVAAAAAGCVWLFGFQTATALMFRHEYRNVPEASETPVPLRDVSISGNSHRQVSWFGYNFELPWDDVDEARSRTVRNIRVTAFHSGNTLSFYAFPARNFVDEIEKDQALGAESFRRFYGTRALQSDYGFYKIMLGITPEKISPFGSRQQVARDSMLLITKVVTMPSAGTGIFSIQANDWRGFQFGEPSRSPAQVTDELYGNEGGVNFIFFLKSTAAGGLSISQPEINRVLQSLHKVSDGRSASATNSAVSN